jgi:drug/metabolite transporter (DMT)-like permease
MSMTQAFRVADATAVMPLDFMKLVWGPIIGYLVFSEIPDIWTLLGGSIIFAGAGYIAYRESRQKPLPTEPAANTIATGKKNPRDGSSGGNKS